MDWLRSLLTIEDWTFLNILAGIVGTLIVIGGVVWGGVVLARHRARTPPAPIRSTPARDVYGREDQVAQIRQILTHGQTGVITPAVTVTGGGGVGKTTLAKYYLAAHRADYTHAHVIPAETEQQLMDHLAACVPGLEGNARARAIAALRRINASPDAWLIVYDNVPDQKAIEGWIPNGQHTHCLVTTRSGAWRGPGFHALALAPLSPEAAVKVLES